MDRAGLEHGRFASQTDTLTIMLFPRPLSAMVLYVITKHSINVPLSMLNRYQYIIVSFDLIILTSLISTRRLYKDRQKPATGTQCREISVDFARNTCRFYMHDHIDVIVRGTAFDEPFCCTGWSKLVTER